MFHTLSELNDREKYKGKQNQKQNLFQMSKGKTPQDNYYGKGNKAYDQYNKRPSESLNVKFEKTKNKITLTVFRNGFIINNGPFRDRIFPENNQFMEEVERGSIPHEFSEKGINDLGILLINRKSEIYHQRRRPIKKITQITQINPININSYNQFSNYDFNQLGQLTQINDVNTIYKSPSLGNIFSNTYNNITYNNNYNNITYNNNYNNITYNNNYNINSYQPKYNTQTQKTNPNQFSQYEFKDPLFLNIEDLGYSLSNNPPETPIGNRNVRKEILIQNIPHTVKRNYIRYDRYSSSVPKKDVKNKFENFNNYESTELYKNEEKKPKSPKDKIKKPSESKENKEKKFTAFGGIGQSIGYINTQGLNVQTDLKNKIDYYKPICTINIRLFTGEIIKAQFNYSQTLGDIYYYIKKVSGSNNFTLLEGFPPQPLINYNMTIGQLNLENTIITQRIN